MSVVRTLLLLWLMLQISEEQQLFVVRSGTTVTLPCGNESTSYCSWTQEGNYLPVITRNKRSTVMHYPLRTSRYPFDVLSEKGVGAGEDLVFDHPDPRSRRLNLTESCDLQIRDVEAEDAGVYVCTQLDQPRPGFNQSQSSSEINQSRRSKSLLSVVDLIIPDSDSSRRFFCDVYPYNDRSSCGFLVKWLVQGSAQNQCTFRTSRCLAEVVYSEGSSSPSPSCEVTDLNHNQVFVLQIPGSKWNQTESGLEPQDSLPVLSLLMFVMRSVELLMVSVVMVILLRVHSRCSSTCNHQDSEATRAFQNKRLSTRVEESLV